MPVAQSRFQIECDQNCGMPWLCFVHLQVDFNTAVFNPDLLYFGDRRQCAEDSDPQSINDQFEGTGSRVDICSRREQRECPLKNPVSLGQLFFGNG